LRTVRTVDDEAIGRRSRQIGEGRWAELLAVNELMDGRHYLVQIQSQKIIHSLRLEEPNRGRQQQNPDRNIVT
jgi:hypothetical protein